ncbi:MAG: hypothetical protein JXR69_09480 [Candidatus Delongbacteria bacterium]|nr:hypothetical protein [Candidatus Delongbacteria bacterium]
MKGLRLKKIIEKFENKKISQQELKEVMGTEVKFEMRRSIFKNKTPYIHFF